ncbi:hypothetical protein pb186bvf_000513 [Paramecium bursaria]
MTTAHRPTFKPAIGGSEQGGNKMLVHTRSYHSKDLPAYLKLKLREKGQGTQDELKDKDFKQDLIKRETEGNRQRELKALGVSETSLAIEAVQQKSIDVPEPQLIKKVKMEQPIDPQDQDDAIFMKSSDDENPKKTQSQKQVKVESDEDSSDKSNSDDDEEALMREYEKVKKQRELEDKKKHALKQEEIDRTKEEQLLKGNPLIAGEDYTLKKKWYEDTIFRNQARLEVKEKQRFINDAVRSDFHRKFLNKYILM